MVTALDISEEDMEFYEEHGYVCLRNVLSPETIDLGKRVAQQWVDAKIQEWIDQGLLRSHDYGDLGLDRQFIAAWKDAGQPKYSRDCLHYGVNPLMYELMSHKDFLGVTKSLLGCNDIAVSGTHNVRLKDRELPWTKSHWHADIFYWDEYRQNKPLEFLVTWYPLSPIDADSGTLQVISKQDWNIEDYELPEGYTELPEEEAEDLVGTPIAMEPGDVLCFNEGILHASTFNSSDRTIWTIDHRYEPVQTQSTHTQQYGFIAYSETQSYPVTPCNEWLNCKQPPQL